MDQLSLFSDEEIELIIQMDPLAPFKKHENPMVRKFGPGVEGTNCKNCTFVYRKGWGNYTWIKCKLRGDSNGQGTDHRLKWQSCSKYEEG